MIQEKKSAYGGGDAIVADEIQPGSSAGVAYSGKSVVPAAQKAAGFTAGADNFTRYEITATGVTVVLDAGDPTDATYEFWDNTGNANPAFTLAPNGSKTINGVASLTITAQYFGRVVRRNSAGQWSMGT